ncbi:ATP-binding protein [Plantactinospora siamensis]|uniref:ATP-binding protein n=1 Tax=Plantactinospora siamensis TaxID=555372 RepID=UPI00367067F9
MGEGLEAAAGDTVLRSRPARPFHASIAARATELAPLRADLRRWLAAAGVPELVADDVLVAVGEACANAIEHGYGFAGDQRVTVRLWLRAGRLAAEIRDTGGWTEPRVDPRSAGRGRGRMLMDALMDEADVCGGPWGTTVRLGRRITPAG